MADASQTATVTPRQDMTRGMLDVIAERRRQVEEKNWTPEHDDSHELGELGLAAALYAIPYEAEVGGEPMINQDHFIGLDMTLEIVGGWNLKPEPDIRTRKVKAAARAGRRQVASGQAMRATA